VETGASEPVTITSVSLHPVQRDGYLQVWVGSNVPQHLVEHWVGRSLTPRQLAGIGARLEGDTWVLNYMGRDYILQTGPRDVADEVVYNEPRPYPVQVME
jgi:hypothetical protein